jgi:PAS domain S-box-containing protein
MVLHANALLAIEQKTRQVVTWTAAGVLAVIWGLFGLWAWNLADEQQRAAETILDRQRSATAEHVSGIFKMTEAFLATADRWVADHPDQDPRTAPGFLRLIRDFQRITGESMLVRTVDSNGTLRLIPEVAGAIPANVSDRDYFRAAMAAAPGRISISTPFQGRSTGNWAVAVATRLSAPSHGIEVVFVAIQMSLFETAFRRMRLNEDGAISLLRRDGALLARTGMQPADLGGDHSHSQVFTEGLAHAGEGVLVSDGRALDGVARLTAYGELAAYPLVITVGQPLATLDLYLRSTVAGVALLLITVSALTWAARTKIIFLLSHLATSREELVQSLDLLAAEVTERKSAQDAYRRSAADLRSILDNMLDVFYRTDRDGRITMLSPSITSVLGYAPDQLIGRPATDFYVEPADRSRMVAAVVENGGRVVDYELCMRHADGHAVWVATSSHLLFDKDSQPCGIEGVFRSIEDRKSVERTLRDSAAMLQALLDASSDAIMLFRLDGTLLSVNTVLAARFGKTPAEITGLCLWDLFAPEVALARRKVVAQMAETGQGVHFLDQRGLQHFDNSIYPVRGENGAVDKVAVYSRDITRQIEVERTLTSYISEVERSNTELEQFAYVASHDLREPLRMISSYLSLIERRYGAVLEGDGMEFLTYARDGARRMDLLILDLLDYSRIERRGDPIIAMELAPALEQAIHHLAVSIEESRAVIDNPNAFAGIRVMGDQSQVMRLLQNLLGNAIKYRPKDRPPVIELGAELRPAEVEITVADNGIGIEEHYFDRIFGIFQRLHTRDSYEGTGIGLAICKKIVERHGGRIWLDSTPGHGTTFHFTLPRPS